jgi:hypothetical protein
MNLRKIILSSLLLSIGLVLHQLVPPILFGMKPDFLLSMMFIAIVLCDNYKLTIVLGLAAGILTAATTTFPGGQLPNIIDKIITSNLVYLLFRILKNKVNDQLRISLISFMGTLVSGTIFLGTAYLLIGLPGPFFALIIGVVIPATVFNMAASITLYNAANTAINRMLS